MELLATFGVAAKELFDYNREMYQFDNTQRLDRELLRIEMQIKRFELFREDIRDLVELTVGKMEMYHVVGALVLESVVIFYTEGRMHTAAPPFILALYWLSAAGCLTYVLLAVWLSMHASISSHSFGVRLLTRFVRLPIPGSRQINALNARLSDFERQGAKEMLRVPFIQGAQQWQQRRADVGGDDRPTAPFTGEGDERFKTAVIRPGEIRPQDLLGLGEQAYGEESLLQQAAVHLPGKHVQLFRRLQAKWQCYDAYARVSMSLGVNQLLMTVSYYCICLADIEYHSPALALALVTIFQCANLALAWLDVAGLMRGTICSLQLVGAMAPFLACSSIVAAERRFPDGRGQLMPANKYGPVSACFFITVVWLEGLLHLAWPSRDLSHLPKRYRAVLFLDVFAIADDAIKGVESKTPKEVPVATPLLREDSAAISPEEAAAADEALFLAEAALRRWQAVPDGTVEAGLQQAELERLKRQLVVWRKALNGEARRRAEQRGDRDALELLEPDNRSWMELSLTEQAEAPFAKYLLGPFRQSGQSAAYFYDLEERQFVWEDPLEREVLTLQLAAGLVQDGEAAVRAVLGGDRSGNVDSGATDSEDSDSSEQSGSDPEDRRSIFCLYFCCRTTRYRNKYVDAAYKEHRLPWRVLSGVTRVLQLSWLVVGIAMALEDSDLVPGYDIIANFKEGAGAERRLGSDGWRFEALEGAGGAWPGRALFRPEAMSFVPGGQLGTNCSGCDAGPGVDGGDRILVAANGGSLHWVALTTESPSSKRQSAVRSAGPRQYGAIAVCAAGGEVSASCLLAHPVPSDGGASIEVRPLAESSEEEFVSRLHLEGYGRQWSHIAGSSLPCATAQLLTSSGESFASEPLRPSELPEWCLVLAAWDGQRLPVAVVPLPHGPGRPPRSQMLSPLFDVISRKQAAAATAELRSLHLEASGRRLWALWADGKLQAWDLFQSRSLGVWRPEWPQPPLALCERPRLGGSSWELLVLSRDSSSASEPKLLTAHLPSGLLQQ